MNQHEYDTMYKMETTYWWHTGMRSIMFELIGDSLNPDAKLLDIGCGTGARLKVLSDYCDTWGIDLSPKAVELSKSRGLENIEQGDAAELPYANETYSHAVCCDVLEAVDDDFAAVKEAYRVLLPGGIYYCSDQAYPVLRNQHDISQNSLRRYTKEKWTSMLDAAGFEIERVTFSNTIMFPALALYRLAAKLLKPTDKVRPEEARSDLFNLPGKVNWTLHHVLEAERGLIRKHDLPFGLTLMAVCRKPDN